MTLPKEAELLGANSAELEIKGAGAHTLVRLITNVRRSPIDGVANASEKISHDHIYLMLENIRGTHDATVLNVYINMPADMDQSDCGNHLVGSCGLYGLRRASISHTEARGLGLTFVFDITRILVKERTAQSTEVNEIRVSIVPNRQLPDSTGIAVGRVSIFRHRHGV